MICELNVSMPHVSTLPNVALPRPATRGRVMLAMLLAALAVLASSSPATAQRPGGLGKGGRGARPNPTPPTKATGPVGPPRATNAAPRNNGLPKQDGARVTNAQTGLDAAWYAEHPKAWQYTHPHADALVVARAATLSNWLGYAVVATNTAPTTTATANSSTPAAQSSTNPATNEPPIPADLDWMSLGAFAASPLGAQSAGQCLQLSVNRQGEIRGNYLDAIANTAQPVRGSIQRDTQAVSWTVGSGGARFTTTLDSLLGGACVATAKIGDREQTWQLSPIDRPTAENAPAANPRR